MVLACVCSPAPGLFAKLDYGTADAATASVSIGIMANNGKTEAMSEGLDVDRELPTAESASAVEQELERVRQERDSLVERLARQQAEFENSRRRAAREQADFKEYALVDVAKALLPVIDSFDRALSANANETDLRAGMELIYRQLQDSLSRIGVQPVRAEGEPFDPRLHEAIEMVTTDEAEDNHVLQELQRGYKLDRKSVV